MTHPEAAQFGKIRAWLQKDAASKSLEEIRDYVAGRMDELFEAVNTLPEASLATVVKGDEWAPIDALKHVVEWNWQVGEDILHVCLMGERPGNPPPTFAADRTTLVGRQRESLESIWAHVSAADPSAFLDLKWEHPFFGELNWREWYLFLGVHSIDHTGQLKQMREALSG